VWQARARPNQAHLATKHIKDLREFIQSACPQNSPKWGQTRIATGVELRHRTVGPHQLFKIALVSLCLTVHFHGPELPNKKMFPTQTNAPLPIENGTGRSNSRDQHQQEHHRQPEGQRNKDAGKIEKRFPARHLWLRHHRQSGPNVYNTRQRRHGQAAALGHPVGPGKATCHTCLVELLQTAFTLLLAQECWTEADNPLYLASLSRERHRGIAPRALHYPNSRKATAKTAGRDSIQACCVLSPPNKQRSG